MFTPPLRDLSEPDASFGWDVVRFSEDVCGIALFPWQKWLLVHALELLPDRSFRFRNVVVLVARQNGKSTLSQILALWFMYRFHGQLVLGTAQDLDTAEEVWQGAVDLVDDVEELREHRARVVLNNGKKSLDLKTGERYKVKAANRRAGRGLSGDLILLDELREHQSWDAWAAITKTTMARPDAMIWSLSNAGDAASLVLRYLRRMAHTALGDPDGIVAADDPAAAVGEPVPDDVIVGEGDDSLGFFEWSAPPGCRVSDEAGWAQANPSLGHGTLSERAIRSAMGTDPEWVFRTEVLCQWWDGAADGPFPAGTWAAGQRDGSSQIVGMVAACVAMSHDRSTTHIAFAGATAYGPPQVELVASRAGSEWVTGWLAERRGLLTGVVVQARGAPESGLLEDLHAAALPVVEWGGPDLGIACGRFYDLVRMVGGGGLVHLPQPRLDVAAATATTRPLGEAWVWDLRNSPTDAAPLKAATGAVWWLTRVEEPPKRSKYEDAGLVVV